MWGELENLFLGGLVMVQGDWYVVGSMMSSVVVGK